MKTKGKFLPVITLIIGLILGSILMLLLDLRLSDISTDEAGKRVKNAYELVTGSSVEVIGVLKESGMYKVIAKTTDYLGQTTMLEVYVTPDGKLMSQRILKLEELTHSLERQREFIECLNEEGLKIYGISNNTATQLQLQVLGGSRFLGQIYVDCVGANLQTCLDAGVVTVPSIAYQGDVYEGVKTLEWFENETACIFKEEN